MNGQDTPQPDNADLPAVSKAATDRTPTWWLRSVGVPVVVLTVIGLTLIWLELDRRSDDSERRVATADVPLEQDRAAPQEGSPAPDFVLRTLDGGEIRLSDLRGRAVLLNFWATWCGPCRDEMPLFEQARQEFGEDRLVILAVNVEESEGTVRPYIERLGVGYPVALDRNGSVARRYRVRSYPTTFMILPDGTVDGRRTGQYTRAILFGRLEQLLGEWGP